MPFNIVVRLAEKQDIDQIKAIADANRDALGFLPRPKIEDAVKAERIKVVTDNGQILGFVIYRHRKTDQQTTLSDICIAESHRSRGAGKLLIETLYKECQSFSRDFILLKCPEDLSANHFYRKMGFHHERTENGRARRLNVWRMNIIQPEAE